MATFGMKDTTNLSNFQNFLSTVAGRKMQVDQAIAAHQKQLREKAQVGEIMRPVYESAQGKEVVEETPTGPVTKRVPLSPEEEHNLTYKAFVQLLGASTPAATAAAEQLVKFKQFDEGTYRKPTEEIFRTEDITEGEKKVRLFHYGIPSATGYETGGPGGKGKYIPTDIKSVDLTEPTGFTAGDRQEAKDLERYRREYNEGRMNVADIEKRYGGKEKLNTELTAVMKDPDFQSLLNQPDEMMEHVLATMSFPDPKTKQKYRELQEYMRNTRKMASAGKNLEGKDYFVNESGALKPLSEKPKVKKGGYFNSGKAGYTGSGKAK